MVRLFDLNDLPSLQEPPSKRKKTGESSSENEGGLDNSRSNDDSLWTVGTELLSTGTLQCLNDDSLLTVRTEPLSPDALQCLNDFLTPIFELESNGSPDREDNHLTSKNEGRLHYSRSNADSLLTVETGPLSPDALQCLNDFLTPIFELESNGSPDREDNHLSSKNEGRLHYSRSNADSLLMVETGPLSPDALQRLNVLWPRTFELESNGSPDREDNHLSSKNEGRLHYSGSNDDLWMKLNNLPGGGVGSRIGKLLISNTEIAKGSDGTIVFEGFYELRRVAVKRQVKGHHDQCVFNEIKNLTESDLHPNIVRYYGVEYDQYFVYLALERCACSLDDLIQAYSESSNNCVFPNDRASTVSYKSKLDSVRDAMQDVKLWRPDGHPSPFLLDLMRDVVSGLAYLHGKKIIHRDLKPQNVLITKNPSLGAKLCDMGISRCLPQDKSSLGPHATTGCGTSGWQAPEQLCHRGRQTCAMDMFSFGCVLFFCVTGGEHPFGECLERDINIKNNKMDLSLVASIPEAHHLISRLLNPDPKLRPNPLEVLNHPFFWSSEKRLSFLRDTSDWVQPKALGRTDPDLLKKLESIAQHVFNKKWNRDIDCEFIKHMCMFKFYKFKTVRDLLRIVRNTVSHYRDLPPEIQDIVGSSPEDLDNYFTKRFPKLLIETYKFVSMCGEDVLSLFPEYFNQ